MTQEDKKLLLIDLSARLPYGVKVQYNNEIYNIDYISALYEEVKLDIPNNYTIGISEVKPYLRPMSSMTEKEKLMYEGLMIGTDNISYMLDIIDWLLKNHFDFRGLIPKGLAIEVTKDNNPYKD
jgi:hypothetical protein